MNDTMHAATTPTLATKRHPIRGALWGIALGVGAALVLIGQKIIALGTLTPFVVILVGILVGIAWALVGPAKRAGDPPLVVKEDVVETDVAGDVVVAETPAEPWAPPTSDGADDTPS